MGLLATLREANGRAGLGVRSAALPDAIGEKGARQMVATPGRRFPRAAWPIKENACFRGESELAGLIAKRASGGLLRQLIPIKAAPQKTIYLGARLQEGAPR